MWISRTKIFSLLLLRRLSKERSVSERERHGDVIGQSEKMRQPKTYLICFKDVTELNFKFRKSEGEGNQKN